MNECLQTPGRQQRRVKYFSHSKTLNMWCRKLDSWSQRCVITATALWVGYHIFLLSSHPDTQSTFTDDTLQWAIVSGWLAHRVVATLFVKIAAERLKCQGTWERGGRVSAWHGDFFGWWIWMNCVRLFNSERALRLKLTAGPKGKPRGLASFSLHPYSRNVTNAMKLLDARLQ